MFWSTYFSYLYYFFIISILKTSYLKYNPMYSYVTCFIQWKCTISQLAVIHYIIWNCHLSSSVHWVWSWGRGLLLDQYLWVSFTKCPSCTNIKCIRLYLIYFLIVFVMTRCCLLAWCRQTSLSVSHFPFCQIAHMKKTVFILTLITVSLWILGDKIQRSFSRASQALDRQVAGKKISMSRT